MKTTIIIALTLLLSVAQARANNNCDQGGTCTAPAPFVLATTGTVTIDWNNGVVQYLSATGTVTLATPSNPVVGQVYTVVVVPNGQTVNLPASFKYRDAVNNNFSAQVGSTGTPVYVVGGVWDGTEYVLTPYGAMGTIDTIKTYHVIGHDLQLNNENQITSAPRMPLDGCVPSTLISTGTDFSINSFAKATTLERFSIMGVGSETCATPPTIDVENCGAQSTGVACGSPTSMVSLQLSATSGTSVATTTIASASLAAAAEVRIRITNGGTCAVPPTICAGASFRPQ